MILDQVDGDRGSMRLRARQPSAILSPEEHYVEPDEIVHQSSRKQREDRRGPRDGAMSMRHALSRAASVHDRRGHWRSPPIDCDAHGRLHLELASQ
jgi:hypothetical protein